MLWTGRVAAINMVLPKLVFTFLNIILDLPTAILNRIQGIFSKCIWGNKRAWVSAKFLEQQLENGGLAIPNIRQYYCAAMLIACLD